MPAVSEPPLISVSEPTVKLSPLRIVSEPALLKAPASTKVGPPMVRLPAEVMLVRPARALLLLVALMTWPPASSVTLAARVVMPVVLPAANEMLPPFAV